MVVGQFPGEVFTGPDVAPILDEIGNDGAVPGAVFPGSEDDLALVKVCLLEFRRAPIVLGPEV
jgi:hypothetical protein